MKVAMICDVMGQPNNGTTLAALNLIRYLRDAGHSHGGRPPGRHPTATCPSGSGTPVPSIDRILRMNGVELAVPDKQLLEAVIREADVVHLLIPLPLARAALKIARRLGKPVTASFHCQAENITAHLGMMNAGWLNRLIYRNFYRKVYRWCTAVHYPTEFIREVFETATHPTPAHVISNGVNDMFRLPDSRPENGSSRWSAPGDTAARRRSSSCSRGGSVPPPGRYPADPCRGRSPAQALPPAGKAVRSGLSVRILPAAGASAHPADCRPVRPHRYHRN